MSNLNDYPLHHMYMYRVIPDLLLAVLNIALLHHVADCEARGQDHRTSAGMIV